MRPLTQILQQESPLSLAREVVWRTRKNWGRQRMLAQMHGSCPVSFRPAGYYDPVTAGFSSVTRDCILRYSDEIFDGRFPFLSYGTVELGFPPAWNVDFVCGKDWPQESGAVGSYMRHDGSDIKVPWELSRLQFLPVLGKAYRLSGEEHYREAAKRVVSDWIARNPAGVGVNWTLAMEAALRAMSVCFLLDLLGPLRRDEQHWLAEVTRSLWQHLVFIEAHSEFSHLVRSNHYLSNIVGLYCLSVFLEGPGMAARRRTYQRRIEREILHQVYEDGGDHESSLGYHVLVMQMFTSALLLMRAAKSAPDPRFVKRLDLMYQLAATLANSKGELPQVGDCDDGRVELLLDDLQQMLDTPLADRHSLRVGNLLGIGSALFGQEPARSKDAAQKDLDKGDLDRDKDRNNMEGVRTHDISHEDAKWYGLGATSSAPIAWVDERGRADKVFPQSGIAVAHRGDTEALFFALPNSIAGKGSHSHNDKLNLIVRFGGDEALCDSGTYCYTRDASARNQFRSTASHNTVTVDGCEQNRLPLEKNLLFTIASDAQVSVIENQKVIENEPPDSGTCVLRASHSGYATLGITHARTVRLAADGVILVEDEMSGSGTHRVEMNWHLAPDYVVSSIEEIEDGAVCRMQGPHPFTLSFRAAGPAHVEALASRISRIFSFAVPAVRIRISLECALPLTLTTRIQKTNSTAD